MVIFIVLLVVACKRDPVPKHAIPRDKFIDVLVDVHIAEGMYTDRSRLKMDSIESTSLYLLVLDKHKVTEDQMSLTSIYYSRNQKEYDKIYAEVLSKISLLMEDENGMEQLNINNIDTIK